MTHEAPTYRTFVTAFTDFLTVAIHTIIYERNIYPKTSFLSARKYNFAVRQSRHPKVCEWISDAVTAVEVELLKGVVERVAVVIYSKQDKPLERFVFDVSRFPVVPASDLDVPLQRVDPDGTDANILPMIDMEEQFRATMNRLANCAIALDELPKGCTFTVAVELRGENNAPVSHPQHWVPAQAQTKQNSKGKQKENQTTPVRAVAAGDMIFETWIEELPDKADDVPSTGDST